MQKLRDFGEITFTKPATQDDVDNGFARCALDGRIRCQGFYSQVNDQTWARSFYHDEYKHFIIKNKIAPICPYILVEE